MKKQILALVCGIIAFPIFAQISHGGQPYMWGHQTPDNQIPFIRTEAIDLNTLAAEDAIVDQYKDQPYRFGVEFEVDIDLLNEGFSTVDETTGRKIVRLGIECAGALSVSLRFDEYRVPKGGEVYVWSADRKEFLGAFNHLNNKESGVLALGLVHGDKIVVEYSYPVTLENPGSLRIGQIVHTYRPFATSPFVEEALAQRGPFGNSGACEVNVNCPEGADWQVEKRAVAVITEGGFGLCSGALVNNTANDGTPYFLTANHCIQGSNTGNWVFYFNHEAANCNGSIGPTTDLISGAEVVANNAGSDFALLLLDDTPPASYDVYYAGWDATDDENAVSSAVCIHHPGGDVKKISFEDDAPFHDFQSGAEVWWIENWELAVTEGGSSGSPLFNQDHRIIGQLYGGASACSGSQGNGLFDYYGRFGVSWNNSNNPSTRLMDWLDPDNTGTLVLNGYPDDFVPLDVDATAGAINNIAANICTSEISPQFTLINQGLNTLTSCTINYQINNEPVQSFNWTGSLNSNQSVTVNLPTMNASNGNNTLDVWVSAPNGMADMDNGDNESSITFNAVTNAASTITVAITFDDYPYESSWVLEFQGNAIYSSPSYENENSGSTVTQQFCLAPGCYDFVMNDEYGDGMCCAYGNGEYVVTDQDGMVLASGGSFDSQETTNFCLTLDIDESASSGLMIYPNPADKNFRIVASDEMSRVIISDMTGRLISDFNINGMNAELSVAHLAEGVYQVLVHTNTGVKSSKLSIRH